MLVMCHIRELAFQIRNEDNRFPPCLEGVGGIGGWPRMESGPDRGQWRRLAHDVWVSLGRLYPGLVPSPGSEIRK